MASPDIPAGYWVEKTPTGFVAHSPYGPLGDEFDCEAAACFAAQEHADSLALEEADELAAIADFEADLIREAA
ncbi:MAG: hypothetical protein K0Q54_5156 [Methylobacterium brachiatum]|jgi:hypothetical protein|nr:hypothetical protein [Methylobacterium brachiatum]